MNKYILSSLSTCAARSHTPADGNESAMHYILAVAHAAAVSLSLSRAGLIIKGTIHRRFLSFIPPALPSPNPQLDTAVLVLFYVYAATHGSRALLLLLHDRWTTAGSRSTTHRTTFRTTFRNRRFATAHFVHFICFAFRFCLISEWSLRLLCCSECLSAHLSHRARVISWACRRCVRPRPKGHLLERYSSGAKKTSFLRGEKEKKKEYNLLAHLLKQKTMSYALHPDVVGI